MVRLIAKLKLYCFIFYFIGVKGIYPYIKSSVNSLALIFLKLYCSTKLTHKVF